MIVLIIRHTDEMIERLERAGLGYRVRAEETGDTFGMADYNHTKHWLRNFNTDCLAGATPLRQLVYRVHPLPLSLLPLVWDFGQLDLKTEKLYIGQMVHHSVSSFGYNY
ncbi:MAG: hypothetical protein V2I33_20690 [Kangiellaceae bacterium]|jgi:hypothetical protein|nr:hypothetical protein [Kangiellaceae bacterium]